MNMKIWLFFVSVVLLITSTAISQEEELLKDYKSNIIFVQSDYFSWTGEFGLISFTANYERLSKAGNNGYVSLSIGGGTLVGANGFLGTYSLVNLEINRLIGRRNHFFEIGTGMIILHTSPSLSAKLGYRMMIGKRFMFRSSCKLILPRQVDIGFSIGLGYRFGGNPQKN